RRRRRDVVPALLRRRRGGDCGDAGPPRDRPGVPRARHLPGARGRERGACPATRGAVPVRRADACVGLRSPAPARVDAAAAAARLGAAAAAAASPAAAGRPLRRPDDDRPRRRSGRARAPRRRLAQLALRGLAAALHARRRRRLRGPRPPRPRGRARGDGRSRSGAPHVRAAREVARPEVAPAGAAALRARRPRLLLARVRRLIFVTQRIDPSHPALGVTIPKLRALAARFDEVVVLAADAVEGQLPANCRVRIYGARTQAGRGARYVAALAAELSPRPEAVLVHMTPLLVDVGGPLVRARRVPLLLWFTHWRVTRRLLLAERLATAILTVNERSFPLRSPKVVPIGHGIDMQMFGCTARTGSERLRVLALGRTSPAKGLETVARAADLAGAELEVRGPSLTETERREAARLEGLGVRIEPPLPHGDIP